MTIQVIFFLQFVSSLVVMGLLARWLLAPKLARLPLKEALFWLSLPHAFRYLGMVFLVPGVVAQPLPVYFAIPAAYGDLLAGLLALAAMISLRQGMRSAIAVVWVFNLIGSIDLVNALRHFDVAPNLGGAWYIPTLLVPALLITHFMIFARLLKPADRAENLEVV